jgi:single-strand DNA-binding protein
MYLNKAIIIGNLTRDPELKSLPSGVPVSTFGIATNRVWKDKEGARQESTDYHNIVVFGRQAETVSQYLKKGSNALIEGRIQTRSWEGNDGVKKYMTEIVADRVQFGPRRDGGAVAQEDGYKKNTDTAKDKEQNLDTIEYPEEDIRPEDIPF